MEEEIASTLRIAILQQLEADPSPEKFQHLKKQRNYFQTLMQIAADHQLPIEIRTRSFIPLKQIKQSWSSINFEQCQTLKNRFIPFMLEISSSKRLNQSYSSFFSCIFNFLRRAPEQILQAFSLQNFQKCLNLTHSYCNQMQYTLSNERRELDDFLFEVFPKISEFYQLKKSKLIEYLILKILFKSMKMYMNLRLRQIADEWLPLIFQAIQRYDEKFHVNVNQVQQFDTQEFFYFHNKKWALRIIYRLYQKYLKENFFRGAQKQHLKEWKVSHHQKIVTMLTNLCTLNTTKKNRLIQLKFFQHVDDALLPEAFLMNKILPEAIKKDQTTREMMSNDKITQWLKQNDHLLGQNIFVVAVELWVKIFKKANGFATNAKKKKLISKAERKYMDYLEMLLDSKEDEDIMVSLRILKQISQNKYQFKSKTYHLISQKLAHSNFIVRGLTCEFFTDSYHYEQYDRIKQIVQKILQLFLYDKYQYVKLSAMNALSKAIKNQKAVKLLKPSAADVLTNAFEKIKYHNEQVFQNINQLSNCFLQRGVFTQEQLCSVFRKIYENKVSYNEQNQKYKENDENYDNTSEPGIKNSSDMLLINILQCLDQTFLDEISDMVYTMSQKLIQYNSDEEQEFYLVVAAFFRKSKNVDLKFFYVLPLLFHKYVLALDQDIYNRVADVIGSNEKNLFMRRDVFDNVYDMGPQIMVGSYCVYFLDFFEENTHYKQIIEDLVFRSYQHWRTHPQRNSCFPKFFYAFLKKCHPSIFNTRKADIYHFTNFLNTRNSKTGVLLTLLLLYKFGSNFTNTFQNDNSYQLNLALGNIIRNRNVLTDMENPSRLINGLSRFLQIRKISPSLIRHHLRLFSILLEAVQNEVKRIGIDKVQRRFRSNSRELSSSSSSLEDALRSEYESDEIEEEGDLDENQNDGEEFESIDSDNDNEDLDSQGSHQLGKEQDENSQATESIVFFYNKKKIMQKEQQQLYAGYLNLMGNRIHKVDEKIQKLLKIMI